MSGERTADPVEIETEVRARGHRHESRRRGLAVEAELRKIRGDSDHVIARVDKGTDRNGDRGRRPRRHRNRIGGDPRKIDVLGGACAHLGIAEVRHVAEAPDETLAARGSEGLDDRLRCFERLADREVGDGLLAERRAKALALHEHAPDPATILELRPRPPGDGHGQAMLVVPVTPPVCQLNG